MPRRAVANDATDISHRWCDDIRGDKPQELRRLHDSPWSIVLRRTEESSHRSSPQIRRPTVRLHQRCEGSHPLPSVDPNLRAIPEHDEGLQKLVRYIAIPQKVCEVKSYRWTLGSPTLLDASLEP